MSNTPIPVDPQPIETISIDVPVTVLDTFYAMMDAHIKTAAAQTEFDAATQGVTDAQNALRAAQDRLIAAQSALAAANDGARGLYKAFGSAVAAANIKQNA